MYDFIMAGFTISEKNDVTLPVGVCCDGFFVTHARGYVRMQDRSMRLPPREAWRGAVPVLDAENPPARLSRDAPVQKSNFMAYNIHAVWQQEVWAAVERSRKYINQYIGGLLTAENVDDAEAVIIASGSAAAQSTGSRSYLRGKGHQDRLEIQEGTVDPSISDGRSYANSVARRSSSSFRSSITLDGWPKKWPRLSTGFPMLRSSVGRGCTAVSRCRGGVDRGRSGVRSNREEVDQRGDVLNHGRSRQSG